MYINFSKIPHSQWVEEQKVAAKQRWLSIVDINAPDIDPNADTEQIYEMAEKCCKIIYDTLCTESYGILRKNSYYSVYVDAEPTFVYQLQRLLLSAGIMPTVPTFDKNGKFVKFRPIEY